MKSSPDVTKEEFDQLLTWLDRDLQRAGEKYEIIRQGLINMFLNRKCAEAEDLADETINRVARKVKSLADTYTGEPARYFHGVARNVLMEYHRQNRPPAVMFPQAASNADLEPYYECLDYCLEKLTPRNRKLILHYYREKKREKIVLRKELGQQMKLKSGALRVRAYRIRATLEKCMRQCLEQSGKRNNTEPNVITD
ncbi:MAG TPA: sigma-70 family RNA polymerase sigma factor [Pyrinomonadaceae bacterium]|jgi:RNA polymerase sigma factor (sigma-70 family)|nr:sigma-70 family RNA polymerase sigma factor [Pyrinomonadaceae bacterium]